MESNKQRIFIFFILSSVFQSACVVKQHRLSYNELAYQFKDKIIRENKLTGTDSINLRSACLKVIKVQFAQCLKLKEEERVLENMLNFNGHCSDTLNITGYQNFAVIKFINENLYKDAMLISYAQDKYSFEENKKITKIDSLIIRGQMTIYTGKYDNIKTMHAKEKFHFPITLKKNIRKGKAVDYDFVFDNTLKKDTFALIKIVNFATNDIGGNKPLVFDIQKELTKNGIMFRENKDLNTKLNIHYKCN